MRNRRSKELFAEAQAVIPGGVNSPVRAFRAVGGEPLFIESGQGAYLTDADGNRYIDCIGSWGPLILGHADERVIGAIRNQLVRGTTFGAPTELEVRLASLIVKAVPSVEKVRMVSSGTEATMSAIRAARGFTGRDAIVKFEGNYHGHADFLLAKAGSGVATLGLPECAGVPRAVTENTLTLPHNDSEAVRGLFRERGREIACVIVEPVVGNMGCVPPESEFLETLRAETLAAGALLIFDEVMTGFRLAYGGAQELFGITPDLTTLGKIVGGGLPLGAYGGRGDIMDTIAPVGPVYQAGTLSGNPVAVTAGIETLRILADSNPDLYVSLEERTTALADGLRDSARTHQVPVIVNQVGSMITVFFTDTPVTDYASAKRSDTARFAAWFRAMLEQGVYWPPSQFEAAFLSIKHQEVELAAILAAADRAFGSL
jgi:glutamate-1-semialdehyde 2,1-aminomutase